MSTITKKVNYYPINEEMARRAKEANSFRDYIPGSATNDYLQQVDCAIELAEKQKRKVDSMYHEKIDSLLDLYARKLAENLNNQYRIEASCPSVMIAGGSNFPVAKKNKQNAAMDRNMEEWHNIQGILEKIKGIGTGGISSDDPDALAKLQIKLEGLEHLQAQMKAVNAYYRKHKTLEGCPDLTEAQIAELKHAMANSWLKSDKPFESFQLTNNNAKIKQVKQRIADLEKRQAQGVPEGWKFEGGEVVVNAELNRLQILFDERPDYGLKEELKRCGFRWAPSQGAWQRQLTDNAIYAAKRVVGVE